MLNGLDKFEEGSSSLLLGSRAESSLLQMREKVVAIDELKNERVMISKVVVLVERRDVAVSTK